MVSIVIPCFNCENVLDRAVESVLNQHYDNWELLLVNNNSTDRTSEIIDSYVKRYPSKIFSYDESRKGAPFARNHGLKKAKGDWIQYLDSDDELLYNKLHNQVEVAKKGNFSVIVGNSLVLATKDGLDIKMMRPLNTSDVWVGLISSKLGITSAMLWKRQLLLEINGWNEALTSSQEYDLLFRVMKTGAKIGFDHAVETHVYKSEGSISMSRDVKRILEIIHNRVQLRLEILTYLKDSNQLTFQRRKAIYDYVHGELSNNQIDLLDYEAKKLGGKKIPFHYYLKVKTYWGKVKRLLKN